MCTIRTGTYNKIVELKLMLLFKLNFCPFLWLGNMEIDISTSVKNGIMYLEDPVDHVSFLFNFTRQLRV